MNLITGNRASGVLFRILKGTGNNNGKWLIPSFSCYALPLTFFKAGKQLLYYDLSPGRGWISGSTDLYIQSVAASCEGILLIDYFGYVNPFYDLWIPFIKNRFPHLKIIMDRCLGFPVTSPPEPAVADVYLYSSGYAKCADIGYGGFAYSKLSSSFSRLPVSSKATILTDQLWKKALRENIRFDISNTADWLDTGDDQIQPDYMQKVADVIPAVRQHKHSLNQIYNSLIPQSIVAGNEFNDWRFQLLVDQPDRVIAALQENSLFASRHYACISSVLNGRPLPFTKRFADSIINLFNDFYYTAGQAEQTAKIILDLYNRNKIRPVSFLPDFQIHP